jgi:O-antigen/teichoic acid export membrane protein
MDLANRTDPTRRLDSARLDGRLQGIKSAATRRWSDPLSRGGMALLANTGLTGALGFGFWIIAAHIFSTSAVGVAGALVAATTLFAGLGQLNLSGMLMRFLPTAGGRSRRLVLAAYIIAASGSVFLAAISLTAIRIFASPDSPLRLGMLEATSLVLAAAAMAIFTIEDNVLVSLRQAVWVPVENGAFGVLKIGILFIVMQIGTGFSLFSAWMISLTLIIPIISAVIFFKFLPPAPRPRRVTKFGPVMRANIIRFAAGDAVGGFFTQSWTYLLPIIITASLGASANALFYTSFLFSSTLDQVAANYASPLTVEGAHNPEKMAALIRQALRQIFMIILPAVAVLVLICPWLLHAFGDKYTRAAPLLELLLIACLPKAISTVYYAYCRVRRNTHKSAIIQGYVCTATLIAVALSDHILGLTGVGITVVTVQSSAAAASGLALRRELYHAHHKRGRHRRRHDGDELTDSIYLPVIER